MNAIARGFLYFFVLIFFAIGSAALFDPQLIAARFGLSPQSIQGVAEARGLYGGGFLGWGLLTLGALRCKPLSPGLLIAMATMMGSFAAARVVSLMVDQEFTFSLPACIGEILIALACWIVYKHDKAACAAG